jgi:hypothetical protein
MYQISFHQEYHAMPLGQTIGEPATKAVVLDSTLDNPPVCSNPQVR